MSYHAVKTEGGLRLFCSLQPRARTYIYGLYFEASFPFLPFQNSGPNKREYHLAFHLRHFVQTCTQGSSISYAFPSSLAAASVEVPSHSTSTAIIHFPFPTTTSLSSLQPHCFAPQSITSTLIKPLTFRSLHQNFSSCICVPPLVCFRYFAIAIFFLQLSFTSFGSHLILTHLTHLTYIIQLTHLKPSYSFVSLPLYSITRLRHLDEHNYTRNR